MSVPGQYLHQVRLERGFTMEGVACATGICPERQARIETGEVIPSYGERRAYARMFGFACVQALDEGWRSNRIPLSRGEVSGRIPVINLAPAGRPRDYTEPYIDSGIGRAYIDPPPGICGPDLFAFEIDGDSMEPDYPNGHYAICRPAKPEEITDGQPVLVRFDESRDHECTFKKCYTVDAARVELRPVNPRHPAIVVEKSSIIRMSPVIAVMSPQQDEQLTDGEAHRIVGDDVQQAHCDENLNGHVDIESTRRHTRRD